jgi:DNA-binding transcriptional LysR family regulator
MAPTLAIRWLAPRLADFVVRHPDLDVELSTNVTLIHLPVLDGIDFSIRLSGEEVAGEDKILLFHDQLAPVCAPATAAQLKTPADLARVPMLHSMLRAESWQIWLDHMRLPIDGNTGPRFANAAVAYQAAIDGLGVAIGQLAYVERDLSEGRLVQPFPEVAGSGISYYLVSSSYKRDWYKIRVFREWLEQVLSRRR